MKDRFIHALVSSLRLGLSVHVSVSDLLDELDHADALSLVEGDGAAQTVELPREPQRRQALSVSVAESPCGISKRLPGALRGVQRVQSDAVEGTFTHGTIRFYLSALMGQYNHILLFSLPEKTLSPKSTQ